MSAFGLLLALAILPACRKAAPEAAGNKDAATWVGRENIVLADQVPLQVGPPVSGTLTAEREATVRAELTGAVREVRIEPGQPVSQGELVLRLDDTGLRDAYQSAQAAERTAQMTAELAKRNADRSAALAQAGAIADRDLETARWNQTNAEAGVADAHARTVAAERQLSRTEVRAPFAGIISERQANIGDVVQPGNPLFTVIDPGSLQFEGAVPAEEMAGLKVGTAVTLTITAAGTDTVTGKVKRINPAVDPATRQVRVTVEVPNAAKRLVAGLFAEGRVVTSSRPAIVIPLGAVDRRGLRPTVARLRGGRVEQAQVALGLIDEAAERVEVTGGLSPGDTVLVGGARGLAPGTVVRVGSPVEQSIPATPEPPPAKS